MACFGSPDAQAIWRRGKRFEGIDGLLEPVEPTGRHGRIVGQDSLIEVVEVSLGAERQFNELRHGAGASR